jgi:hypothetical protein
VLDQSGVPGLHEDPGWSGGWRRVGLRASIHRPNSVITTSLAILFIRWEKSSVRFGQIAVKCSQVARPRSSAPLSMMLPSRNLSPATASGPGRIAQPPCRGRALAPALVKGTLALTDGHV